MAVYQTNVTKNKADLKQAQYKDIDDRYCGQFVQLKVEIADLVRLKYGLLRIACRSSSEVLVVVPASNFSGKNSFLWERCAARAYHALCC